MKQHLNIYINIMTSEFYEPEMRKGECLYLLPDIKELILKKIDEGIDILVTNALKSEIPLYEALLNPATTMHTRPIFFEVMDFSFSAAVLPRPGGDIEIVLECLDTGDHLSAIVEKEQPLIEGLSPKNIRNYFDKMLNSYLTYGFQTYH